MIADIIRREDEEIRDLVLSPAWARVTLSETATLTISWLVDPFASPPAVEGDVAHSGGETLFERRVSLGLVEIEELDRDVWESAWLIGAPDATRTEEDTVLWAFSAAGVRDTWREPKSIGSVALRGAGNRVEMEMS